MIPGFYDRVAPADIDVVGQMNDNTLGGKRCFYLLATDLQIRNCCLNTLRQNGYPVSFFIHTADDSACIPAVVMKLVCLGPDHKLYLKTGVLQVDIVYSLYF